MDNEKEIIEMPTGCPNETCGSEDIEYGDISIDGDEASQQCRCNDCETIWHDVFKFSHRQLD